AVLATTALVIVLWFFYNWIIFGNPLEFQNGALAPATQSAELGTTGATKGHLLGSAFTYATAALENLGPVILVAGAIAIAWSIGRYYRRPVICALVVLGAAATFNIVALFLGQSTI